MRLIAVVFVCAAHFLLTPTSVQAQGATHDALVSLAQDVTYTSARLYPLQATALGIPGYDADLETPSEEFRAAYIQRLRQWQQQLQTISAGFDSKTSLVDRDDATLLAAQLAAAVDSLLVYQTDRKDYSAAANGIVAAIFTQFENLPVVGRDGATPQDVDKAWHDIISRLAKAPAYIVAAQRLATTPGHLYGVVGAEQLGNVSDFFRGALDAAAKAQFRTHRAALAQFERALDAALATIAESKAHIDAYAASWPENFAMGRKAYDELLRREQLLPYDSRSVEQMGRDELAHGWAEEAWLTALARRNATPFGAPSGGGMAPSGAPLIDYYRDRIAELRRFVLQNDVVTIPDWLGSMQVIETPAFLQPVLPGAAMNPPRPFAASTTGYYYITPPTSLEKAAASLDMNEDFDHDRILSTAAHEAMPGHFLQLSIARRHPDFIRKIQNSGVFAEGWAFYGEEMFVKLGLYGGNLDGRLHTARWERVRGVRAIVDPQLASGELTYEQAVEFFATQTGYTKDAARAAVAGIATSPGYVIAYTVGRLQLENLLGAYLLRMGGRGSLHDFHDRLLSYGTTPFAIVAPELLADLDQPANAVRAAANF
ncbi:MAG TPA: DUF885 family protein [Steroidobacteraceae bacterium]